MGDSIYNCLLSLSHTVITSNMLVKYLLNMLLKNNCRKEVFYNNFASYVCLGEMNSSSHQNWEKLS